jgi:hypothetical protein
MPIECTTASASLSRGWYVAGLRMSADFQETDVDHGGALGDEDTADQVGSPERLEYIREAWNCSIGLFYLIEVTSQPRATADLHIREP